MNAAEMIYDGGSILLIGGSNNPFNLTVEVNLMNSHFYFTSVERTNYGTHVYDDAGIADLQVSVNSELQPVPNSGVLDFTQNVQIMSKATKSVLRFRGSLSRAVDAQRWVGTYGNGVFDGHHILQDS